MPVLLDFGGKVVHYTSLAVCAAEGEFHAQDENEKIRCQAF
jgi:hypothetical protein